MSNFPNDLDTDVDLPRVDDNIVEIGSEAINAIRDAVFNIEENIGVGAQGSMDSISERLGVSIEQNGNIKASALVGLGLITLPITNAEVSSIAAIDESKLNLDHNTTDLYNSILSVNVGVNTSLNFISNHGFKLEPHIAGSSYNHYLSHIDVASSVNSYFKNKKGLYRDNTNLYTLTDDLNKDFVSHQKADSTSFGVVDPTSTSVGTIPPDNYAHVASGLYLNTSNFSFVPQTATDLQQFAQFIDNSNISTLGTRIQTLYQNGIPRSSRAAITSDNEYGQLLIPLTGATTYHLDGGSSAPVDDIDNGDDVIELTPETAVTSTNVFDAQFSQVKAGDVITVNYGTISTSFVIREKKYVVSGLNKRFIVRINGKNILATTTALVQINRPLYNIEKYGVLAVAQSQVTSTIGGVLPSLIVGAPRGAETLGNGFNGDLIDSTHYNLHLVIYPKGDPSLGLLALAPIDVSGNQGATPGQYTLESVVEATNNSFRKAGFNYRFIAYSYNGNFGVMLADSYSNTSFSIVSGIIASGGSYDQSLSQSVYINNVVDVFNSKDALGFGPLGANVASPPYAASYSSDLVAQTPTKLFVPLTRKTFYVNGVERERLSVQPNQDVDSNGDGYWPATITDKQIIGARVKTTYQVNRDISVSGIGLGKTIVVQPEGSVGTQVDYGRFIIENVQFNICDCEGYTDFALITVYDSIHGVGNSPYASAPVGTATRLYFSSDSVGFNIQNLNDEADLNVYKRHMEVLINQDGYTFTQERARINTSGSTQTVNGIPLYGSGSLQTINIYRVSPKLRGYAYQSVKKINLQITSYNQDTGIFSGYLCNYNGTSTTQQGPTTVGKKGQPVRFYDNTNVDYIDFIFDIDASVPTISTTQYIDIQLFPTLSLDEEVMLLATVQVNDAALSLSYLRDARQFGNVSESQLSTSALDYIAAPTRLLNENGIIRGFEVTTLPGGGGLNTFSINGGTAIVNGKIINLNNQTVAVPIVREVVNANFIDIINWFVCVNDKGEIELVFNSDFDYNDLNTGGVYTAFGLDHNRIVTVTNPNVTPFSTYKVRSSYLADIVQKQRDLVVIGILITQTDLVSGTYVITGSDFKDARRFVYNGHSGLKDPLVLSTDGNFRTFPSLITWLNQLVNMNSNTSASANSIGAKVIVKGAFEVVDTSIGSRYKEDGNTTFGFNSKVIFEGDSGTFVVNQGRGLVLGDNTELRDLNFKYNYELIISTLNSGIGYYSAVAMVNDVRNVTVNNCTFTSPTLNHGPWILYESNGETYNLQNVKITNNTFSSLDYGVEDKNAAIAITYQSLEEATLTTASKLIDLDISGNICNKNQLILISAVDNGSAIFNSFATINTRIHNNICGAIGYLNRKDTADTINSNFVLNKDNSLHITKNTCRFIYTSFLDGSAVSTGGVAPQGISYQYSGTTFIKDNVCSWIHSGFTSRYTDSTNGAGSDLIIKDNKLSAYDINYLDEYYSNYPAVQSNYAIWVRMTEN